MKIKGYFLYFLSPEALFLTKLGQLTTATRSPEKVKRDRKVINALRKKIDLKEIKQLISKFPDSYWRVGLV